MSLETILKRDRTIVAAGLIGVTALAWLYLVRVAGSMSHGAMSPPMDMGLPRLEAWGPVDLLLTFLMWTVMMGAMMIPSTAPMILLFAAIARSRAHQRNPVGQTAIFLLAYLLVWASYSALATLTQWALHSAALLSPMMVSTSRHLGGGLLIVAGMFQWTPLKRACLLACRSPLGFIMSGWRDGPSGALRLGLHHGAYCVGCCWALMALLFVAGVMNLAWVAVLAAFVLIEKLVPGGQHLARAGGVALVAAGVLQLAGAWA